MSHPAITEFLNGYLTAVPTPSGVTSRELVLKAIRFDYSPRMPYSFTTPLESDFAELYRLKYLLPSEERARLGLSKPTQEGATYYDEWGVGHRVTGRRWDHAFDHPLADLANLSSYRCPDVAGCERFSWMAPYVRQAHDAGKFVVAGDPIMMFERLRALMGFEAHMMAPYIQPRQLHLLLEQLTALVIKVIQSLAATGPVDGFMTWEDFGLQDRLQIRIQTFREFYKPYYARIVEAAHQHGMVYIWHNCGQILQMIPDLIEIGVEVLQLDQPRLMTYERLADTCDGRICLWNTLDIQWSTRLDVTSDDFADEIARMVHALNPHKGGLMARQYPAPQDIDLTDADQMEIYRAFMANGCSLQ